jgi:hypothetical protein
MQHAQLCSTWTTIFFMLKQLCSKLHKHNSILTHADKGKIIIIVNNGISRQKKIIISFLIENLYHFLFLPREPTGIYQKQLVKLFIRRHSNRQTYVGVSKSS